MSGPAPPSHVLLERSQTHFPPTASWEVRVFSKCRNERLRLPAFLRHYRALGASRFFIVDNGSSDGTLEYLLEQSDVHVFSTDSHFKETRGGATWLNTLLGRFGVGSWCVTVDIDELLCYPGSEIATLPTLTAYLDKHGYEALPALLLDLYPPGPIAECVYASGEDLLAAAPYFDAGPYRRLPVGLCPDNLILGGPRERVFYADLRARSFRRRLSVALYRRIGLRLPILRRSRWFSSLRPRVSPCLTKVPVVKWDAGSHYLSANHFVSPKRLPPETGVVLHFKFLGDFPARVRQEAVRGEYFDGASEYKRYAECLARDPCLNLMYEGSLRFRDTAQLVALGLMQDSAPWKAAR
jgi:hypothetical protein